MLIQPRSYQAECVQEIYKYFGKHSGNPVCALPTGTGKSVVIAMFLESVFRYYPSQKVMVLTHVKELIAQNYQKLMDLWPTAPAGINSAGLGQRDVLDRIIFAGIGSVAKQWHRFGHVDLIIIDEAHLVSQNEEALYQRFLSGLRTVNPALKVIGFTATPWRLGQGRITEDGIFTDLCFDITGLEAFNRLIAEGYLAKLIPKQTRVMLDTDGVHMRGGEFIASELQIAVDKDEITAAALREAMELGHDRKHWLIFASGVQHAINIADMLTAMGEPCLAVHSKMSTKERDEAIAAFKSGRVRALANNNVLTTGFDFPGIDLILMLRPTASPVLWVQMLGRGTRPAEGKENCLVLDFAGNTQRLGPINDPKIPRKKGEKQDGDAPVKLCNACATWNHASVRHCVFCGAEFPIATKLKQDASTQELIKGELPVVDVFKIDHITFREHTKIGKPPMVKVSYYCGYKKFDEFVCIEHEGFAGRKAREWWRLRSTDPVPHTTAELLEAAEKLCVPTHMRVWVNKQYPEVLSYCFDGTAFGSAPAPEQKQAPSVETLHSFNPAPEPGRKPVDKEALKAEVDAIMRKFGSTSPAVDWNPGTPGGNQNTGTKGYWDDFDDDIPF